MSARGSRGCEGGTTLLELLVALGIGLGVLTIVATSAAVHLRLARSVQDEAARVADLIWAARILARDLRDAGLDPSAAEIPALGEASSAGLLRLADRDADGEFEERSEEHIEYRASSASGLLRRLGRQGMSLLRDLAPGGLVFHYFDAEGRLLEGVDGVLTDDDRARVARVEVAIETRHSEVGGDYRLRVRAGAALRARIAPSAALPEAPEATPVPGAM